MAASTNLLEGPALILHLPPVLELSADQFFYFCQSNRDLRIERTAEGDLVIMTPAGGRSSARNAAVTTQLTTWAIQDGRGVAFDSSAGFNLPNGATRSPDAAWVLRSRLTLLTPEEKEKFLPLCPDFVIELRSPSDELGTLKGKMQEYLDNGAQLGWLIDPARRRVFVYRPGQDVECLEQPTEISGDPLLPGFRLTLGAVWEPGL